jgi:hypothetical protein
MEIIKKNDQEKENKLEESNKQCEKYKAEISKLKTKKKELKREITNQKNELIQNKQEFVEKVKKYKGKRNELLKKAKNQEILITKLQLEKENMHNYLNGSIGNPDQSTKQNTKDVSQDTHIEPSIDSGSQKDNKQQRPRSLENTGKYPFKDLSSSFLLDEFSGQLKSKIKELAKKKNMKSERASGVGKISTLAPLSDKIITDSITEKSKSFYSDEAYLNMDARNVSNTNIYIIRPKIYMD